MGLVGILLGLALLMWLAYRGWSVLMVAPVAALLAAAISGEPLLAHWTQTFMPGAGRFVTQWFPMFLLGGLFGKLMDDSGSITSIARFLTERLGTRRTMLSVVLASAVGHLRRRQRLCCLFRAGPHGEGDVPGREHPASLDAGDHRSWRIHVHDVGNAGNAVCQQCHSDAVLRHNHLRGARVWASSLRSSFWLSACGGSAAQKRPRAGPARAMVAIRRCLPIIDETVRDAGDQLPAILIQLNFSMASTVPAYPPLRLPHCRWL